ncbi:hypothetical protein [Streptomyces sp. NPDC005731]|uniref:hypothetical protein n=1 Tax=unclassified Streptomyces TaxID=2593676 RepID=UPI0033F765FE
MLSVIDGNGTAGGGSGIGEAVRGGTRRMPTAAPEADMALPTRPRWAAELLGHAQGLTA